MPHRIKKVNQLIREEIAEMLQRHIKDPRLSGLISVTEVETSPDLRYAKIYVSCICNEDEKKEILQGLTSASSYIRGELSRNLRLRRIPEISFCWDESIARGARIIELIDKVCPPPPPTPKRKTTKDKNKI